MPTVADAAFKEPAQHRAESTESLLQGCCISSLSPWAPGQTIILIEEGPKVILHELCDDGQLACRVQHTKDHMHN